MWEGSRPTLWAGLCDAVWERTRSVLSEGRCPSSVGGVTSYSMRGCVTHCGRGHPHAAWDGFVTWCGRGCVMQHGRSCHALWAGRHVHSMGEGPCQYRVGQVSFWTDRKFWNSIEVLLAQRCECTKCH